MAIAAAKKANVPIAVCGEMAGEVELTRLLLGMGLRKFSMHPAHLLSVKQRVLTTDFGAKPIVDRMRRADDPQKLARAARQAERMTARSPRALTPSLAQQPRRPCCCVGGLRPATRAGC